jgi:hypothetical protein
MTRHKFLSSYRIFLKYVLDSDQLYLVYLFCCLADILDELVEYHSLNVSKMLSRFIINNALVY